jgi:hypothetical protein
MTEAVLVATFKETEAGLVPEGEGWFVVNARDAPWWRNKAYARFPRGEMTRYHEGWLP